MREHRKNVDRQIVRDRVLTPTPAPRGFTKLPECSATCLLLVVPSPSRYGPRRLAVGVACQKASPGDKAGPSTAARRLSAPTPAARSGPRGAARPVREPRIWNLRALTRADS